MKKAVLILLLFAIGCQSGDRAHKHGQGTLVLSLNEGKKWKADASTRSHVAAMKQLLQDERYAGEGRKDSLAAALRSRLDLLVQQCTMEGSAHDALHVWLQQVMEDVKALRTGKNYEADYKRLKKNITAFDDYF